MAKNSRKGSTASATSAASLSAAAAAVIDNTLLMAIARQGINGMYVDPAAAAPMKDRGYITINTDISDGQGNLAGYITDAGVAYLDALPPGATSAANVAAPDYDTASAVHTSNTAAESGPTTKGSPMEFKIVSNFTPKAKTRSGAGRSARYPFDSLEVGGAFFIPVSDKHPEPWKSLASTVGSATQRYREGTGQQETATVRSARRDANGNVVKGDDGKTVYDKSEVQREKMRNTRVFGLEEGENEGVKGAWVYRSA